MGGEPSAERRGRRGGLPGAAHGVAFFDYIAADPQRSATVGKAMVGIYGPESPKIAGGYPFGRFNTLIDIGGGQGHIIAEILQQHPALRGALLDLPPTAELARISWQARACRIAATCSQGIFLLRFQRVMTRT